jgi:hypothetical protein
MAFNALYAAVTDTDPPGAIIPARQARSNPGFAVSDDGKLGRSFTGPWPHHAVSFFMEFSRNIPNAGDTIMPEKDHLGLTREELYSLVWAKLMTEVGQEFHISDRAMAKVCARRQVPVPPRGYWAKKSAGKSVPKLPLPEFVVKPPKEMKVRVTPAQQTPEKRKVRSVFEERNQTIKKALKEFRKPLSEAIDYTMRIEGWNCDYSFGLNSSYDPLHRDDGLSFLHESLFFEYRDLVLRGVFLAPAKLRDRKCEARLVRRAHLDKKAIEEDLHRYEESPPKCVGGFSKQDDGILDILAIPEDAFAFAHQNAAAHKIKFMTLRGEKLRYGRGDIYRYSFQEEQDE